MAKAKVLVVDDEVEIVRAVEMRLKSAGYDVVSAVDGAIATQIAIRELPDLIILDIGMPCGDGHTVARRLKENLKTMAIPIIFLTARTSQQDLEQAQAEGAAGYLTKPFKSQELLDLAEKALAA